MPRARAAVCGTSVSFAVTIFKDILNHVYRGSILLDVRKPFCTKLLYTSCLMRADAARAAVCGTSVSFQRYLTVMMPIGVQVFLCVRSYSAQSFYTSCLTRAVAARAAFCRTGVSFAVTILKDNLNRGSSVSWREKVILQVDKRERLTKTAKGKGKKGQGERRWSGKIAKSMARKFWIISLAQWTTKHATKSGSPACAQRALYRKIAFVDSTAPVQKCPPAAFRISHMFAWLPVLVGGVVLQVFSTCLFSE